MIDDSVDEACIHCNTATRCLTHIKAQHNINSPLDIWLSLAFLFLRRRDLLGQTSQWNSGLSNDNTNRCFLFLRRRDLLGETSQWNSGLSNDNTNRCFLFLRRRDLLGQTSQWNSGLSNDNTNRCRVWANKTIWLTRWLIYSSNNAQFYVRRN